MPIYETNCACCGNTKEMKRRKYCAKCETRLRQVMTANIKIDEAIQIVRKELNVTEPPKPTKPRSKCPCEWGRKTGDKPVCMFRHCVKDDGFNAGRVRLRGD